MHTCRFHDLLQTLGDLFPDLDTSFRQAERALISLLRFGIAGKIAVFFEMLDGAGNIGFVLLADIAKLLCGQRFILIKISIYLLVQSVVTVLQLSDVQIVGELFLQLR